MRLQSAGAALEQPHTFSFTTPTVKLLQTNWYRRDGRAGAQMVILLRFNQRVRPTDLLSHVTAAFERHDWAPPVLPASTEAQLRQMDPQAPAAFNAKVAATRAIAESNAACLDPVDERLGQEEVPAGAYAAGLRNDDGCASREPRALADRRARCRRRAGRAAPASDQQFTIEVEKAFFIDGFSCSTECDPERWNPVGMRSDVKVAEFAKAVKALDLTAAPARPVTKAATPRARPDYERDEGKDLTLEDAGFNAQPPSRTYAVTIDSSLTSSDGQTLGYSWTGTAANWHQRAFTSFGDGHGVWESGGGPVLPFYARNFRNVTQWSTAIAPDPADADAAEAAARFRTRGRLATAPSGRLA